jgi:PAS domain S-box-containing protein
MLNNADKRLEALYDFQILDSMPEREFTQIVDLASAIFEMPIALISILDKDRVWFKAKRGIDIKEAPAAISICKFALESPDKVLVLPDTWSYPELATHPFVTSNPYMRFYAGAPLKTSDGFVLGTICVMDQKPRSFGTDQERTLRILANLIMKQMHQRKERIQLEKKGEMKDNLNRKAISRLIEAQLIAHIGNWEWDLQNDSFYWSDEMYRLFGIEPITITYELWQNLIHPDDLHAVRKMLSDGIKYGKKGAIEYRVIRPNGELIWVLGQGSVQTDLHGQTIFIRGTAQDISELKIIENQRQHYTKTLEEMLFAMSHKIRRPVASILGLIEAMRADTLNENNLMEYANYFQISAEELDAYVNQLTVFLEEKQHHLSNYNNGG